MSLIASYLDHLRVERRLSGHTLESYGRDLAGLAAFAAGADRRLENLDRKALDAFVQQQRTRGQSPRSVARAVAAVRGFYKFLVLTGDGRYREIFVDARRNQILRVRTR